MNKLLQVVDLRIREEAAASKLLRIEPDEESRYVVASDILILCYEHGTANANFELITPDLLRFSENSRFKIAYLDQQAAKEVELAFSRVSPWLMLLAMSYPDFLRKQVFIAMEEINKIIL